MITNYNLRCLTCKGDGLKGVPTDCAECDFINASLVQRLGPEMLYAFALEQDSVKMSRITQSDCWSIDAGARKSLSRILWYVARLSEHMGLTLEELAMTGSEGLEDVG